MSTSFPISNRTPKRGRIAEAYVFQPSLSHHFEDLFFRKSLLESCSKPVESVGPHGIKTSTPIVREWEAGYIDPDRLRCFGNPGKGPVDERREELRNSIAQFVRQS